jgi:hypothetical protein
MGLPLDLLEEQIYSNPLAFRARFSTTLATARARCCPSRRMPST